MNLRPTLVDVADRAQCSKSTVSLALRNDPRIPESTRLRIQACARELNYRPDPALACIAAHRWRSRSTPSGSVVAFVTTNHPRGIFLDEGALRGARRQAEQFGYRLEHFRAEDYPDPTALARVIQHRGIRGVIVGQLMREDYVHKFPWADFCGVACNTGFYKAPLHLVMPDHSHAVKRAFHEAYQRGYRRIGLALFDEPNAIDDFDKVAAYLYCLSFLSPNAVRIPVGHFDPTDPAAMGPWLKQHRPDCVLGLNSFVVQWLAYSKLRVPEQVAFVALMGNLNGAREIRAENGLVLTLLDHCPELLGRTALEQLDILLRTNQQGIPVQPIAMMVEACWIEGETLPDRSEGRPLELTSDRGVSLTPKKTALVAR
jgi:DNA-binding LacI/PurR family transcriptional regulator